MWEEWIKGLEPHGIIKASQLVWCQDSQRVNSHGLRIPKSVSWYMQGMWELKLVAVLSNAQPSTRGNPIYNRVREVPLYIPQGYVKGRSIYQWYVEEPCESQNLMLTNNDSSYVLRRSNTSPTYHSSCYVNFNLQLPLILTCTVRWMHDVLTEK